MSEMLFWRLHDLLQPYMNASNKRNRGATPNGDISTAARLSMAIRWFAGGDPADIFQVHGVSYGQVLISVWIVVDAINQCETIKIRFPTDYDEQQLIAKGFESKSQVDFPNCVGCIDGMLVWISKPTAKCTRQTGVGPRKFFCGRKKKFGITLQAICDHKRRFLDIELGHPGSTSDYLCFTTSSIHRKLLANDNFLAPNLTFFGDSAYVNTSFMATPFKGTQSGPKDAYNFYHSQVRITIECAFGILVHRWGVLRKPLPVNLTVSKTTQLVRALCILHNYCINGKEDVAASASSSDRYAGIIAGGFQHDIANTRPHQLLDGGHESRSRSDRRREQRATNLPRERLLAHIVRRGIRRRPLPMGSTSTNA
jgi:hypothetical protein